jgi:hypothetical protein
MCKDDNCVSRELCLRGAPQALLDFLASPARCATSRERSASRSRSWSVGPSTSASCGRACSIQFHFSQWYNALSPAAGFTPDEMAEHSDEVLHFIRAIHSRANRAFAQFTLLKSQRTEDDVFPWFSAVSFAKRVLHSLGTKIITVLFKPQKRNFGKRNQ